MNKKLTTVIAGLSLVSLLGCDTPHQKKVDEIKINTPTRVEIVKNINQANIDDYSLNIYDSSGALRASFHSVNLTEYDIIVHKDSGYSVSGNDERFQVK